MSGDPSFDQKEQKVNSQTNIASQTNNYGASAPPPVPHQIPQKPADFTGREEEIAEIFANFNQGATISGLRGMGGVGKTALALFLAEKLNDRFPDGQIFLDMQGTSPKPMATAEAMVLVIRAYLGAEARLPEDLNGLRGLYNSVLSGKRTLILLDNAASREQVEPLLPSTGSALLITSRNKFVLPGLKETDLDVLPLIDAKKLLLEIAGRIGGHSEELAKLCGCLPLALRNAASALAEKKNLNVADYVERLNDARKRLDLVEASFSLSHELLTPELQKLWCLLSVFPADFDRAGAAAVWEMEPDPAEEALGELVKWSLVDFLPSATGEGGRYRLHDLARVFADSRQEFDARELAQQRHAKHYQELLWKANELFLRGGGESLSIGLIQFDTDWMNIQAGQKWAKINAFKSPEIAEICSNFAWAGAIMNLRLHPLTIIEWSDAALVAVLKTKNRNAEGAHLGHLGNAYSYLGETRKAIKYYEQALKIDIEIGDRQGEGNGLASLGNAYARLGEPRKAIEYYEQGLKISREIRDRLNEGNHLNNLGNAYSDLGEMRKAIEYNEQALAISREIGDQQGEGKHLGNLGLAYTNLGEMRKAIDYSEQALKISRKIGDMRSEGCCLGNLGMAYSHLGETRKAIDYHEQALKISRKIGDRLNEGSHLNNLGNDYSDLGETRKAIEFQEQALKIAHNSGNRSGEGACLGSLGNVYSHMGEPWRAIEFYEQALKIARDIGDRLGEGIRLGNLGNAYFHLGEPAKAIEYYEQALEISRMLGDRLNEGNHLLNMSLALEKLDQRAKAIELSKSALEIYEQIESPYAEQALQQLKAWQK